MSEPSWIRTFTGNRFDPLNPDPLFIRILDIAHALSNITRFSGHTSRFYSVAIHSVLVSKILEHQGFDRRTQFEGLMHDASEAYLVDIPKPIKIQPFMQGYRDAERKLEEVLAKRFNMRYPLCEVIKKADVIALAMEARDLMGDPKDWESLYTVDCLPWTVETMPPLAARDVFLARFATLLEDHNPVNI